MCNLYSITTNQAAVAALFRVVNRYVGNLAPMPGVFPDYPAPVIRNTNAGSGMTLMRWGMPPPRTGGPPVTNIRNSQGVTYEAMTCGTPAEPPESPLALIRTFVMRKVLDPPDTASSSFAVNSRASLLFTVALVVVVIMPLLHFGRCETPCGEVDRRNTRAV